MLQDVHNIVFQLLLPRLLKIAKVTKSHQGKQ